ncbi:MAG: hypothetical protein ABFS16_12215 [Bacteroidota bacterium]
MKRREFLHNSAFTLGGIILNPLFGNQTFANLSAFDTFPKFKVRRLTSGPKHHFFGYYGMSPWNRSETKMVCLESGFHDRLPNPGEAAKIGLVHTEKGTFTPVTETQAWNLQQGSLIHWNPLNPDSEIIYNDQKNKELVSVKLNVESGNKTYLPRPVSAVSIRGQYALSLTYGRLSRLRKVVGYANAVDPYANQAHPEKDGVFLVDLRTNETKLIVSIAEVFEKSVNDYPALAERHMWFNHTVINPSGTRFLFLARGRNEKNNLDSAMFTANIDGSDLQMVIPFGSGVSHFGWRNDNEIIATFNKKGEKQMKHYLFPDKTFDYKAVGDGFIIGNGHCTFTLNGRWMATDRKSKESSSQSLWLYDMKLDKGMILCNFPVYEKKYLSGDTRCDFHPRWNPSGNKICFDAIDTATLTRQIHLVEFL